LPSGFCTRKTASSAFGTFLVCAGAFWDRDLEDFVGAMVALEAGSKFLVGMN